MPLRSLCVFVRTHALQRMIARYFCIMRTMFCIIAFDRSKSRDEMSKTLLSFTLHFSTTPWSCALRVSSAGVSAKMQRFRETQVEIWCVRCFGRLSLMCSGSCPYSEYPFEVCPHELHFFRIVSKLLVLLSFPLNAYFFCFLRVFVAPSLCSL